MSEEKKTMDAGPEAGPEESAFSDFSDPDDVERLLRPIPGDNPAGAYLRYEGTYDRIQEARREDDPTLPQGVWERTLKKADWKSVRTICTEALETRSKDLQIAVWLTEALLHQEGFAGAREGIRLLTELCDRFWDDLYPEIAEDDMESRISPFVWMNEKLSLKLRLIPITNPLSATDAVPHTFADWENASMLEKLAAKDRNLAEKAELEGKITRAKFLGSVMFSPTSFYSVQLEDLTETLRLLALLNRFLDEKCGRNAPALNQFRNAAESIQRLTNTFLQEKLEKESDDDPPEDEYDEEGHKREKGSREKSVMSIRNRAEAYRMLSAAADYLLIHEPHSPTPYLVKRAVSWGHMSLTELLHELIADEHDLQQILKLLGLKGPLNV